MGYTEKIGQHANYPNVLGETTFKGINETCCPPLTLHTVNDTTVTFEPLVVTPFDTKLTALGVHTGLEQKVQVVSVDGQNSWGSLQPAEVKMVHSFQWTEHIPAGEYQASVVVDAETATRILELEREHKEDAEYAYAQTIEHLANQVTALVGQQFTGADVQAARRTALQTLASRVGERLVPAYPMVPANWSLLARQHCLTLLEKSKSRDTIGNQHHVRWTARLGAPGVLHLVPEVPARGDTPATLLLLTELTIATPNWDAETAPSSPFSVGQAVEVTTELILDGGNVPVGWRGTFDGDASNAAAAKFTFRLHGPSDEDPERLVTLSPEQLSALTAETAAPTPAPAQYHNPFQENDVVKTTSPIPTTDGEIPAGAIGQFYADYSSGGKVALAFDFPGVMAKSGNSMSTALIEPAYLTSLQTTTEPLPTRIEAPPDSETEDSATNDSADSDPANDDTDDDPDDNVDDDVEVSDAFSVPGAVLRWAGAQGVVTGQSVDTLTDSIASSLRAARDNAREKTT